ncbi:MAG: HAD-IA family hydrolase [Betaproteobacteria bacterium]|nr:HAD-IA family hydrolase [Betaproteobacteria bacterium]
MASTVLFDFDGTLADTAADLSRALNRVRAERGLDEVPLEQLRGHASSGARGLLQAGMGVLPEHDQYAPLREAFLKHYAENICIDTRLFPGVEALLSEIEWRGLRWGIVTNKSTSLTRNVVKRLGLAERAACVVCGDTTPHLKPHPAPLLHAAGELQVATSDCVYLGDDLRDIQAARAAGMRPVAVAWGYGENLPDWNAEAILQRPEDLISRL